MLYLQLQLKSQSFLALLLQIYRLLCQKTNMI